ISGAGTSHIIVEGVPRLTGARHRVLPDRIETGTYAMAVAMAGGDVLLEGARTDLLETPLQVLARSGVTVAVTTPGVRVARTRGRRRDDGQPGLPPRPRLRASGR